ncbi:MAG TPA: hypothetical protein V6C65_24610 [Allocoleopsis sp.]
MEERTVQQQMCDRIMGYDLFNLRRKTDEAGNWFPGMGYELPTWNGINDGGELRRFDFWLQKMFGDTFDVDFLLKTVIYPAALHPQPNLAPIVDCWGNSNNIFYVRMSHPDDKSEFPRMAIAFFQRGVVHEMYDSFMLRGAKLIEDLHLYI